VNKQYHDNMKPYRSLANVHSMGKTDILEQEQNAVQRVVVLLYTIFASTEQWQANKFHY